LEGSIEDTDLHQKVLKKDYCLRGMSMCGLKPFLIPIVQGIEEIESQLQAMI